MGNVAPPHLFNGAVLKTPAAGNATGTICAVFVSLPTQRELDQLHTDHQANPNTDPDRQQTSTLLQLACRQVGLFWIPAGASKGVGGVGCFSSAELLCQQLFGQANIGIPSRQRLSQETADQGACNYPYRHQA